MSFINEQNKSHSEGLMNDLVFEELGTTSFSKEMYTEESPRISMPYMQDQCLMITKKVSSEYDELLDDQEVDQ